MRNETSFGRGVGFTVFILLGFQAVRWLINPADHPEASQFRTMGVGLQALVGFGAATWLYWRERAQPSTQ